MMNGSKLCASVLAILVTLVSQSISQTITYFETGEEFNGPFSTWKSVKDYNAKGDGSTDDYQAITTAISAMRTNNTNTWNVLYFPAGTYMISQSIYYANHVGTEFEGMKIVGQDPATTMIKCMSTFPTTTTGTGQGAMLRLDASYGNISRISFDGNSRAAIGLLRDGTYGTSTRITDMFFSNLTYGICYGGTSDLGEDLSAIMRCRFSHCTTGLRMTNQNCMGLYTWYCLFEDCGTGIDGGGGFAMPMCNVFLRSTVQDICGGLNGYPIIQNTSVGSKVFLGSIDNWCMVMANGNKIYNSTTTLTMRGVDVMIDNVIKSVATNGPAMNMIRPNTLCVGNTFTVTNPVQTAGRYLIADQKIVSASSIVVPTTLPLPGTPQNKNRTILEITRNTGNDAAEIQKKVLAACSTSVYGVNPVIHFPKGQYSLRSTVVIPRNFEMQLVGDGGMASGSRIGWGGTSTGPCFRLMGPSRVTITDICFGLVNSGADAITVENADQVGGRIYCDQIEAMGNTDGSEAAYDWLIDGIENTDVSVINHYIGIATTAVEVRGGPFLKAGLSRDGQVSFINGYLWGNHPKTLNVTNNGRLLFLGYRNENNPLGVMTLTSASSGVITFACNNEGVATYPTPAYNLDGFNGTLCAIANASWDYNGRTAPVVKIRGDGTKMNVLAIANMFPGGLDTTSTQVPIWDDQSTPAANAGSFLNDGLYWNPAFYRTKKPNIYKQISGAAIDTPLVFKGLEQLRALRLEPPIKRATGVTDVKMIRCFMQLSTGRTGMLFKADTALQPHPGDAVLPHQTNGPTFFKGRQSRMVIPMGKAINIPVGAQSIELYSLQGRQIYSKVFNSKDDVNQTIRDISTINRNNAVVVRTMGK